MSLQYLSLQLIDEYAPAARRLGVSVVARSSRGFMAAYRRAGGDPNRLSENWAQKRDNFVARHMAQVKANNEPLWQDGLPTRRHLALIMWAYSPSPARLEKLAARMPINVAELGHTAESARHATREEIMELFVRLTREIGPQCRKADGWIGCDEVAYYVAEALREHGIDAKYVEGDASYGGHGEPTEHGFHVWIVVEDMVLDPKSLLLRDAGESHWRYWNYEESFLDEPLKRTRFATIPFDDAYVPDPLEDLEVLVRELNDVELFGHAGSEFTWKLTDNGFHVLGIGGSRIVVALDADRVAKIDAQPDGPNNANERDVWDDYGETGLLAPIIDERADGRILVMRRAAAFEGPSDSSGRVASVPRRLRKKLNDAKAELTDLLGPDFVDPSYDFNWGLLDDQLVCIDYAS